MKLRCANVNNGTSFDISKFETIENTPFVKPLGGLWGCPAGSINAWEEWATEGEGWDGEVESFEFTVDGNVLVIDCEKDLDKVIWHPAVEEFQEWLVPDFEAMMAAGVDAIWLTTRGELSTESVARKNLYGWDCESVLVLNPACIVEE